MPAHAPNWQKQDILDGASLRREFVSIRPELVIHLAAKTVPDERATLDHFAANILGVPNVIDAVEAASSAERTSLRQAVSSASSATCRRTTPTTSRPRSMGSARCTASNWCARRRPISARGRSFALPASGVPGSACHIATSSTRSSAAGTSTRPAETRKSNGHVENTVHQLQRLAACPPSEVHRRTFVVADYPAVSVRAWAEDIREALGARPIRSVPWSRSWKGSGSRRRRNRTVRPKTRALDEFPAEQSHSDMVYDTSPLEALVGLLPYSSVQGVKRTVSWLEKWDASNQRGVISE